ncbi:hypothetical protein [Pontibacter pamirensis]|uniref:hypothetical protein n=1 Tax=Pontibacter pamirensis TaxID=2562824 RepID=UPI001389A7C2|nr:hypothetical protein [Pontibacter pamirensis]
MDLETANYIVTYYRSMLSEKEDAALRHLQSIEKLEGIENRDKFEKAFRESNWLSNDPNVLNLLNGSKNDFILNTAKRILKDNQEKVLLNNCPNCGKLARTPQAKQCRFCGNDWH